jgi:hypothetical protein
MVFMQFQKLVESNHRIGLLTNCSQITLLSNYGVPSKSNKMVFATVVYVEAKKAQRANTGTIKVIGEFDQTELELILMAEKGKLAWFYDLDRISSHFR